MNERVTSLARMAALREAQRRAREAEFVRAVQALHEAERALYANDAAVKIAREAALRAAGEGARGEWMLEEHVAECAARQRQLLQRAREECELVVAGAREKLREAERHVEQVEALRDAARAVLRAEGERRAQGAADDRYAARRRWTERAAQVGRA